MSRTAVALGACVALLLSLCGCGRRGIESDGETRTLHVDGEERSYVLHVPPELRSGERLGLLVALHGGGSTPEQFEKVTAFDDAGDRAGLAVAYLAGIGRSWNAGDCCGPATRRGVDDVAFVRAVIDDVAGVVSLRPGRVFATGWSNGGKMAYRLACELSERIAAIGVVGTGLGVADCRPVEPVSILHLHGTADRFHPFDGGQGELGPDQVGAPETIATWRRLDGCGPASRDVFRHGSADCREWSDCARGTAVELCTIRGMGHQWPGHEVRPVRVLGPGTEDIDATQAIMAFLGRHGAP